MTCCGPNGRKGKPRPMQKGEPGKSAYDIWKENQPVGSDTSLDAYLKSMQGKDGKSAYQTWLDAGNVGTESQFLASLKGKNGTDGVDGTDGTNGTDGKDGVGIVNVTVTTEPVTANDVN